MLTRGAHLFVFHKQVIDFLLLNQECDAKLYATDGASPLHYLVRFFPPESEPKKVVKWATIANKLVQKVSPLHGMVCTLS